MAEGKVFVVVGGVVHEAIPSNLARDAIDSSHEWKGSVGDRELEVLVVEPEPPGPAVSILLPTYNYGHRIEGMLKSLEEQSFKSFEVIVVDDGSTDKTVETVIPWVEKGLVDRLILHGQNLGAAAAINTAAQLAQGRFVTWVSADNTMTADWLEDLVGAMKKDRKCGVAYAQYDRFNDAGPQPGVWGKAYDPERLVNDQNCYIGPAFLVRSSVWEAVGPLRGKNSCDYDHWLRAEEACWALGFSFAQLPKVLCHYYSGAERATVARKADYDAGHWQAEAKRRRGLVTA